MNVCSKFDDVPCCQVKDNILIGYNSRFEKEFKECSCFKKLITTLDGRTHGKNRFDFNNKSYNVYSINNEEDGTINHVIIDITGLVDVLDSNNIITNIANLEKLPKLNIKEIDDQHSELASKVNHVIDLHNKKENLNDTLKELLDIVEYTKEHFKTEEDLMKKYDLIDINHIEDHTKLLNYLNTLVGQVSYNNMSNIIVYLKSWLIDHIINYDLVLSSSLKDSEYKNV